ncbi:hypothetical protein [Nocardia mexicana]|uniref:Uncharacterized protein n=1 Tax=Nocardia mexicana TaxID=279262 RepID=A0A370H1C6_9NOCA|nr:hypothetical protein [Nocardia mexicana]RDI49825.1 hypothetical protein DFR68_106262 [Nocardia mexicana]
MRDRLRAFGIAGAAVVVVVVVVVLGWAIPPRPAVVTTDRLGPESGEPVAEYLTRARDSLGGNGSGSLGGADTGERWALVSFGSGVAAAQLPEHAAGLRISQVLYHVPIDRVFTPVITVPVAAGDAAAIASGRAAAGAMAYVATDPAHSAEDRVARTAAVVAARLQAECPCAVGMVVRGPLDRLREMSSRNDIRAVEALPPDAAAGAFAVVPLLPEQVEAATSGPDDGPVPDR